jgi:hypothetical protein
MESSFIEGTNIDIFYEIRKLIFLTSFLEYYCIFALE